MRTPLPSQSPHFLPAHPHAPDEIFIPAGVPHSTKNIAAVNSKWFYVSDGHCLVVFAIWRGGTLCKCAQAGARLRPSRCCLPVLDCQPPPVARVLQGYDGAANSWF